jgi:hypothetical protein
MIQNKDIKGCESLKSTCYEKEFSEDAYLHTILCKNFDDLKKSNTYSNSCSKQYQSVGVIELYPNRKIILSKEFDMFRFAELIFNKNISYDSTFQLNNFLGFDLELFSNNNTKLNYFQYTFKNLMLDFFK